MADFRFNREDYAILCTAGDLGQFKSIVDATSDRSRLGPTTFCPPPSTDLPSPLVNAASYGRLPILQYIFGLYQSVNVDATSVSTSLIAACMNCPAPLKTIRYLVAKGADVNQQTEEGQSPLLILGFRGTRQYRGYVKAIKFLVKSGANVNQADRRGNTLLFGNYPEVAVELGADMDHRNAEGYTALHIAAETGNKVSVGELLKVGLPPLFSPSTNSAHPDYVPCPLYLAAAKGHRDIANRLANDAKCYVECRVDTYLLLGVAMFTNFRRINVPRHRCISALSTDFRYAFRADVMQGYDYLEACVRSHHPCNISYPSPRPEYDYHVEIRTKDELDAVWGTDEFQKKGLIAMCLDCREMPWPQLFAIC